MLSLNFNFNYDQMKKLIVLSILLNLIFQINAFSQKKLKSGKIDVVVLDQFIPSSSITVLADNDPLMIRSEIEGEFMFSDIKLKVISPSVAQRTISAESNVSGQLSNSGNALEGSINQKTTIDTQETITVPTVYALTFEYSYNPATGGLMNFSGEIVDLKNGEIVVKFRRQGSSSIGYGVSKKKVIADLVEAIKSLSK